MRFTIFIKLPFASLMLGVFALLVGCSSNYGSREQGPIGSREQVPYGSREQASIAADRWVAGGKYVVVEYLPHTDDVKRRIQTLKAEKQETCSVAQRFKNGPPPQPAEGPMFTTMPADVRRGRNVKFLCSKEALFVDEDAVFAQMTTQNRRFTRWCNWEKETRQYVCKERNIDYRSVPTPEGIPISPMVWDRAGITFTHFRY